MPYDLAGRTRTIFGNAHFSLRRSANCIQRAVFGAIAQNITAVQY